MPGKAPFENMNLPALEEINKVKYVHPPLQSWVKFTG
jgi:hypothetical protein